MSNNLNDAIHSVYIYKDGSGTLPRNSSPREGEFQDQVEYEPPARVRQERDSLLKEVKFLREKNHLLQKEVELLRSLPHGQEMQNEWDTYAKRDIGVQFYTDLMGGASSNGYSMTAQSSQATVQYQTFLQKLNGQKPGAIKKKYGL